MKLGLLSLAAATAALLGQALGSDIVGSVYLSQEIPLGDALNLESKDYFDALTKYTREYCQSPDNKITYVIAENLKLDNAVSQPGVTYPWVYYGNAEESKNIQLAENCLNVHVENLADVSLAEFIQSRESLYDEHNLIIVQKTAEVNVASEVDEDEVFLGDLFWQKDASFEGNFKRTSSNSTTKGGSLFTHYQFFTPGILSCLILSSFLVFVLYVALSWMTSIEITYLAFDKQIDYEKKTE